jgi:PAS domain S-box-containing protein
VPEDIAGDRITALQESELRYRRLFETAKDGILILDSDTGLIIDVNPFLCELLGYTPHDFVGKHLWEIGPLSDVVASRSAFDELLNKGYVRYEDLPLQDINGREVNVEFVSNLYRIDGHSVIQCNIRDITERRQLEMALQKSEALYRTLVDNISDGITVKDTNHRVLLANIETLRRWGINAQQEVIGKTNAEILAPIGTQEIDTAEQDVISTGRVITKDIRAIAPFAPEWVEMRRVPLKDDDGQIIGVIAISRDITERRKAEEATKQSWAFALSTFNALAAHICVLEYDGTISAVNQPWRALAEANGIDPAKVSEGFNYLAVCDNSVGPDSEIAKAFAAGIRGVLRGEQSQFGLEYPCHSPSQQRWFWGSVTPFAGDGPVRVVVAHVDITERKVAERALDKSNIRLSLLRDLDQALLAEKSPLQMARLGLYHLRGLIPYYRASVIIVNANGKHLAVDTDDRQKFPRRLIAHIVNLLRTPQDLKGTTTMIPDLREYTPFPKTTEHLISQGVLSLAMFPMVAQGRLIGAIVVARQEANSIMPEEVPVAEEVARSLGLFIHNSQLLEQVSRTRDEMSNLSRRLVTAQEEERRNVARELHDEIGQVLTGIKLTLDAGQAAKPEDVGKTLRGASELVNGLIGQVRNLSLDLRPAMLDDLGLLPALLWHIGRFEKQTGLSVDLAHRGIEGHRFAPAIETAAYRIVQEALTNVARHANATNVKVEIDADTQKLTLSVQDNGAGFALERLKQKPGAGISGMRERAGLLGGTLRIRTSPDLGACVIAELPLLRK